MLEKKIYVLGDSGCGKSALLYALTGSEAKTNSPTSKNCSVRRTTHVNIVHKVGKKKTICCCPCWGGGEKKSKLTTKEEVLALVFTECIEQEVRLRAMDYLDTDAVLLCFDVSSYESLENLKKVWLPEVQYYCPDDVPILLAGLKGDHKRPSVKEPLKRRASSFFRVRKLDTTQREAQSLVVEENIFAYLQCSSKDGGGLEDLKNSLSTAVTMTTSRSKNGSPVLSGSQNNLTDK